MKKMWKWFVAWRTGKEKPVEKPAEKPLEKGMRISQEAIARAKRNTRMMYDALPLPILPLKKVFSIPNPPPGVVPKDAPILANDADIATNLYAGYALTSMYQEGLGFLGYPYLAQLLQRSEYLRACSVMAEEITRKWGKIQCTGDDKSKEKVVKKIEDEFRRLKVKERICDAVEMGYEFGKGQIFIDFGDIDGPELGKELVLDKRKVNKPIKSLNLVEPMWTYPGSYNTTVPLAADYYKPSIWYVMSTQVHSSRLLKFIPFPVPDILKPAYLFGGISLTQQIKPYVDNWLNTRQDVQRVIHSFITYVLKTDMDSTLQSGSGEVEAARAELFNAYKDNNDLLMLNKDSEEFDAISVPLSSLDKLQAQALEHIASAAGQPIIKYTGITPSGLNNSSENEIDVFYDHIKAAQGKDAGEAVNTILQLVQLGLGLEIDPEITWVWCPLKEMTAKEQSDIDKADADADAIYLTNGVVSTLEVRKKLANKEDSAYAGLDVDDVPEMPEQSGMGNGQPDSGNSEQKTNDSAFTVTEEYQEMIRQLGKFDKDQVEMGIKAEQEHFSSLEGNELAIMGIVRDHLEEDGAYYTKLQKMEKGFAHDKEEVWATIKGSHVKIEKGVIVGGAGGKFNGQKIGKENNGGGIAAKKSDSMSHIKAGSKKQDYTEALTKTKAIADKFKGKRIENKVAYIHMAVREASENKKVSLSLKKDADGDIIGAASYYPEKDSIRVSLLGGVGGGSACLSSAIFASREAGFGGAITLTPLRDMDTINYYIKCGFDVKKGSTDFWLSPEAAESFLNRGNK